jgi:hypothetical protein
MFIVVLNTDRKAADDEEVRRRIAALKARKSATTSSIGEFDFDPTQPLRLITPGKPASDK